MKQSFLHPTKLLTSQLMKPKSCSYFKNSFEKFQIIFECFNTKGVQISSINIGLMQV